MIDSRNSAEKTESAGQKVVAMRKERAGGIISSTQVLGFRHLNRFYWHASFVLEAHIFVVWCILDKCEVLLCAL